MALAMGVVLRASEISRATRLQDISFAHIDACFYNGQAHVDFARFMVDKGARLAVPTWTNTSLVSQVDTEIRPHKNDPVVVSGARLLMDQCTNDVVLCVLDVHRNLGVRADGRVDIRSRNIRSRAQEAHGVCCN